MTTKHVEHFLERVLSGVVSPMGYQPSGEEFVRRVNGAVASLAFPWRTDPRGFVAFSGIVSLHFPLLAEWIDGDPTSTSGTIGRPINMLRESTAFTEWKFSTEGELEDLRELVLKDLKSYAMPFIEKYSRMENVQQAVESSNREDWARLGISLDRRVLLLAVFRTLHGDKARAIEILDAAISEREGTLPKRWFDMKELRKRLVAAPSTL